MSENENNEEILEEPLEGELDDGSSEGEYEPDLSYKFKDETRNFDERFSSSIKTKEDEDALRDLYTRADGLDSYKDKYSSLEGKYGELESKSKSLVGGFETLQGLVDKGDMRGLMQALGVDNEKLLDYSESLLDEEELPEKERELIKQNRDMTARMAKMEQQMNGYESQNAAHDYNAQKSEVESMIGSEIFSPIASGMERLGLNVFEQVVTEGRQMTMANGKEPSAVEVMNFVAKKYGKFAQDNNNQDEGEGKKPTLPSVKGSAASTTGSKVRSLADLYALSDRM